jgi:hypothetical protein
VRDDHLRKQPEPVPERFWACDPDNGGGVIDELEASQGWANERGCDAVPSEDELIGTHELPDGVVSAGLSQERSNEEEIASTKPDSPARLQPLPNAIGIVEVVPKIQLLAIDPNLAQPLQLLTDSLRPRASIFTVESVGDHQHLGPFPEEAQEGSRVVPEAER